jgi:peroxiredoxin family protein
MKMDMLIKVNSGWIDSIMPSLLVASKLKKEGVDVVVFFDWRALVAFADKEFKFSPSVAKYATTILENTKKMGLPGDLMDLLKAVKADGVTVYGCAVEAALTGITEKIPAEIELLPYEDLLKPYGAKKIVGGF